MPVRLHSTVRQRGEGGAAIASHAQAVLQGEGFGLAALLGLLGRAMRLEHDGAAIYERSWARGVPCRVRSSVRNRAGSCQLVKLGWVGWAPPPQGLLKPSQTASGGSLALPAPRVATDLKLCPTPYDSTTCALPPRDGTGASTGALSVRALPGFRPASRVLGRAKQAGRLPVATGRLRGSCPLSPLHSASTIEPPPRTQWSTWQACTLACACNSLRRAAPCKLPGMQLRGVCGKVNVQLGGNPKRLCASFPLAAPSAS